MKNYRVCVLFGICIYHLVSCINPEDKELEIELLNKKFYTSHINEDFSKSLKKVDNIVRFRIKNNTDKNYLLNLYCFNDFRKGCSNQNSFPQEYCGLDMNNLIIREIKKKKPLKVVEFFGDEPIVIIKNESFTDSIINNKLNLMGYTDEKWNYSNRHLSNNIIYIKAREIKYFETYLSLPISKENSQYIRPLISEDYEAFLFFNSDSTDVKKYLNWYQVKNIIDNKYIFYHGLLESNSIPVSFKE